TSAFLVFNSNSKSNSLFRTQTRKAALFRAAGAANLCKCESGARAMRPLTPGRWIPQEYLVTILLSVCYKDHVFLVFLGMPENADALAKKDVVVSTTFSKGDRLYVVKGKNPWERPQVSKNRGFKQRHFAVSR